MFNLGPAHCLLSKSMAGQLRAQWAPTGSRASGQHRKGQGNACPPPPPPTTYTCARTRSLPRRRPTHLRSSRATSLGSTYSPTPAPLPHTPTTAPPTCRTLGPRPWGPHTPRGGPPPALAATPGKPLSSRPAPRCARFEGSRQQIGARAAAWRQRRLKTSQGQGAVWPPCGRHSAATGPADVQSEALPPTTQGQLPLKAGIHPLRMHPQPTTPQSGRQVSVFRRSSASHKCLPFRSKR